jgi:branched-chain amino acid transport system permease protein
MRPAPETAEEAVDVPAGEPKRRARDSPARYSRIAAAIVLLGCALALPFLLDSYWVFTLTEVMIYAIATIGLDLVFGRAGQLSLAQASFFGLGAYLTALTAVQLAVGVQLLLVLAAAIVAGVVVAVPTLRLSGLRLALVTLLFGELFIWAVDHMGSLTGGTQGLVVAPLAIGDFNSQDPVHAYIFVLAFAVVATLIAIQISRAQFGRRLLAVRDSELAARSVGVGLVGTKVAAFILSAVFAGVAGWLYAYVVGFIAPPTFDLFPSVYFLIAVILGGAGRVAGSWLGAAYIVLIPQAFSIIGQPNLFPILGGGVLIVVAVLLPGGLMDGASRLARWSRERIATLRPRADATRSA